MKERTNYILADCKVSPEFSRGVEEATSMPWKVEEHVYRYDSSRIRDLWMVLWISFTFLIKHWHVGNLLAWQQRFGMFIAFFNRYIFHRRKLRICIMTFIYKPKSGFKGKLYHWFIRKVVTSKCVTSIVVFSESEVAHYSQLFPAAVSKFRMAVLGVADCRRDFADESLLSQRYVFTAGRSLRDYDFLYKVFDGWDVNVKIASPNLPDAPTDNIEPLRNCRGKDMHRYLYNCQLVVVPLSDLKVSAGQLFLLHAMQFGKPIIITNNDTIHSYVEDGVTGVILPNDVSRWREAIAKLLNDPELRRRYAANAFQKWQQEFTMYRMGQSVGTNIR